MPQQTFTIPPSFASHQLWVFQSGFGQVMGGLHIQPKAGAGIQRPRQHKRGRDPKRAGTVNSCSLEFRKGDIANHLFLPHEE